MTSTTRNIIRSFERILNSNTAEIGDNESDTLRRAIAQLSKLEPLPKKVSKSRSKDVDEFLKHVELTGRMYEAAIPADPEEMNDERSDWAEAALETFVEQTGTEFGDVICDMLTDMMHFADRHGINFEKEIARAQSHYYSETGCYDSKG